MLHLLSGRGVMDNTTALLSASSMFSYPPSSIWAVWSAPVLALFQDKLVHDDRDPIATFQVPFFEGTYALLPPKMELWIQTVMIIIISAAIQAIVAAAVYYAIIKRRGSKISFLIGYGIIVPLSFQASYWLLEVLELQNKDLKVIPSMLTTVLVCRTIASIHDVAPPVVESSFVSYVFYMGTMVHHTWENSTKLPRRVIMLEVLKQAAYCIFLFHVQSLFGSFMIHHNFQVFDSPVALDSIELSWNLLSPKHLANCYFLVLMYNLLASVGLNLAAFGENLKGFSTPPVFLNPVFTSKSPSDFWGRRWNLTMHRNLKFGIFRPLLSVGMPKQGAALITFCASGLIHDFYTSLIFYGEDHPFMTSYNPFYSKMLAFFAYNYLIMALERLIGPRLPKNIYRRIPSFIRSTTIAMALLPISHWFTSQWVLGGYYDDKAIGLWQIVKVS